MNAAKVPPADIKHVPHGERASHGPDEAGGGSGYPRARKAESTHDFTLTGDGISKRQPIEKPAGGKAPSGHRLEASAQATGHPAEQEPEIREVSERI